MRTEVSMIFEVQLKNYEGLGTRWYALHTQTPFPKFCSCVTEPGYRAREKDTEPGSITCTCEPVKYQPELRTSSVPLEASGWIECRLLDALRQADRMLAARFTTTRVMNKFGTNRFSEIS